MPAPKTHAQLRPVPTIRAVKRLAAACKADFATLTIYCALNDWQQGETRREHVLDTANKALDAHGVETLVCPLTGDPIALYVNTGDTYSATLLYSYRAGRFYVTSYGDWYGASPEYRKYQKRLAKAGE